MPAIGDPPVANTDQGRPTKAERKEQARLEREEIQRKQASRSRNRTLGIIVGVIVVAAVAGLVIVLGGNDKTDNAAPSGPVLPDPSTLDGIMQTAPPWPNNLQDTNARLNELNLPSLSETILHHHVGLYIYVNGQPVTVPAGVGYNDGRAGGPQVFSPLHTHDNTGLVHVESADPNFQPVLGQFMDVWGVYFTKDCLGSMCNQGNEQLRVFVDGKQYTGDPTLVPLTDLAGIVITYGSEAQLPDPMPSEIPSAG
jgi:hypothetical protein